MTRFIVPDLFIDCTESNLYTYYAAIDVGQTICYTESIVIPEVHRDRMKAGETVLQGQGFCRFAAVAAVAAIAASAAVPQPSYSAPFGRSRLTEPTVDSERRFL